MNPIAKSTFEPFQRDILERPHNVLKSVVQQSFLYFPFLCARRELAGSGTGGLISINGNGKETDAGQSMTDAPIHEMSREVEEDYMHRVPDEG